MPYCSKCGHKISDSSKFCEHCGAKISEGDKNSQNKQYSNKKSNTKWFVFGGIALLVFALIIFSDSDPYEPDTTDDYYNHQSSQTVMAPCPYCGGTGIQANMGNDIYFPSSTCYACKGSGLMEQEAARKAQQAINQFNNSIYGGGSSGGSEGTGSYMRDVNVCWNCNGSGKCSSCAGRGERRYSGNYGQPGGIMDCSICHGTGRCQACHGRGRIN